MKRNWNNPLIFIHLKVCWHSSFSKWVILHVFFGVIWTCWISKQISIFCFCLKVNREIQAKMRVRFDAVKVPRNITINDLCLSLVINLVRYYCRAPQNNCFDLVSCVELYITFMQNFFIELHSTYSVMVFQSLFQYLYISPTWKREILFCAFLSCRSENPFVCEDLSIFVKKYYTRVITSKSAS